MKWCIYKFKGTYELAQRSRTRFVQAFAIPLVAHPLYIKDHKQINYLNFKRARTPKRLTGKCHMVHGGGLFVCGLPFTLLYDRKTLRPFVFRSFDGVALTHNRRYTFCWLVYRKGVGRLRQYQ